MKSLASLEVKTLVSELQVLINARLDSVYQPTKEEIWLQVYGTGLGKKFLRIISGKVLYLTEKKPSGTAAFALLLRKKLKNARIRAVEQHGFERVITIVLERKVEEELITRELVIELFGQGNVLLLKHKTIIAALHYKKWKDRSVLAKQPYVLPKKEYNVSTMNLENIAHFLKQSKEETIVKALAIELGLGGVYAEEVCSRGDIDKNSVPETVNASTLHAAIQSLFTEKQRGIVYSKGTHPFPLKTLASLKHQEYPTLNEALDEVVPLEIAVPEEERRFKEKQEKLLTIIASQEKSIKQATTKQEESKAKAELLYQQYQEVTALLANITKLAKEEGWDAVKKAYPDVNLKEKTITLEL